MKNLKNWLSGLALQLKIGLHNGTPDNGTMGVTASIAEIGKQNKQSVYEWLNDEHKNGSAGESLLYEFASVVKERDNIKACLNSWKARFYSTAKKRQMEERRITLLNRMHEIQREMEVQNDLDDNEILQQLIK